MKSLALNGLLPVTLAGTLLLQPSAKAEDALELELLLESEVVESRELELSRGGEADAVIVRLSNNQLEAHSYNNLVWDTVTGGNLIGEGAFSGLNGLATIVQNTGNAVVIQEAVTVNIDIHTAP